MNSNKLLNKLLEDFHTNVNIIISNKNIYYEYIDALNKSQNEYINFEYTEDDKNLTALDVAQIRSYTSLSSSVKKYILINRNIRKTDIQNSLLKMLEELNPNIIIIIIAESTNHILKTILSRAIVTRVGANSNFISQAKKKLIINKKLDYLQMVLDLEDKYLRGLVSEKQMKDFVNMV